MLDSLIERGRVCSTVPRYRKDLSARAVSTLALSVAVATAWMHASVAAAGTSVASELGAQIAPAPELSPGQVASRLADGSWLLVGGQGSAAADLNLLPANAAVPRRLNARLAVARNGETCTLMADGRVLVFGGRSITDGTPAPAEIFDPNNQAVSAAPLPPVLQRSEHTVSVLTDGRLLVVGGMNPSGQLIRSIELIDPVLGSVQVAGNLAVPRLSHHAALMPDGTVLFWGGKDAGGAELNSGEVFDPASGQIRVVSASDATKLVSPLDGAQAPSVKFSLPTQSSIVAGGSPTLDVRFSKRLNVASLNTSTVTLIGPNGPAAINVTPAEYGELLFITPTLQLLPSADYTLFIQGGLDNFGQKLPMFALGFRTMAAGNAHASSAAGTVGTASASIAPAPAAVLTAALPPAAPGSSAANAQDDDTWTPTSYAGPDHWRSGRWSLANRTIPRNPLVRWALHGDEAFGKITAADALARRFPKPPEPVLGVTTLAGQVLKLNGLALANATLSIGSVSVRTDDNGEFELKGVPSGHQVLVIDGTSANTSKRTYGRYEYGADIVAGRTNALPFVIWMTPLDTRNVLKLTSPTTSAIVLTSPTMPGFEMRVPAGVVVRDSAGKIVTELTLTPVPLDQAPFPLPRPAVAPMYFTVQPGGSHLETVDGKPAAGIQVVYPNYSGYPSGMRVDFVDYDPRGRGWFAYGHGTVSGDSRQLMPDAGTVLQELTGAYVVAPPPPKQIQVSGPPPVGPPPCGCTGGDPVDLATGLFLYRNNDLSVADAIPMSVERAYRPASPLQGAFGLGSSLGYDMMLIGDPLAFSWVDLVLANGSRVHFTRVTAGNTFSGAVFTNTTTQGGFLGAVLSWNGSSWVLRDRWNTQYLFDMGDSSYRAAGLKAIVNPAGDQVSIARDPLTGDVTSVSEPSGRFLSFSYDAQDRISQVQDNIGRTVKYTYDAGGRLWTFTDAAGNSETYTYETKSVDPTLSIGGVSTTTDMLTVTDRNQVKQVTNTFDANGRLIKQQYADGSTWTATYSLTTQSVNVNGISNPQSIVSQVDVTDERKSVARIKFDSAGQPIAETLALGLPEQQAFTYERDPVTEQLTAVVDPLLRRTEYTYDSLGNVKTIKRLAGTASPSVTSFTYDDSTNQLTSVTDPNLNQTTVTPTAWGAVGAVTDALHHTWNFDYTNGGSRLTGITDPLQHTMTFFRATSSHDLVGTQDALGNATRFSLDAVGRISAVTNPLGISRYFSYDKDDRLITITDAQAHTAQQGYDNVGNLTAQTDQNHNQNQFKFDGRNRAYQRIDPSIHSVDLQYESGGQVSQVKDRNGQITGISYDGLGRTVQIGYGATSTSPTTYKSTVVLKWDAGNRLTDITDSVAGAIHRTYDGLDNVLTEITPQGTVTYTYDLGGRRQSLTVKGQPTLTYIWDAANRIGQIQQAAGPTNGNVVQTVGFTYDDAGRQQSITLPNGIVKSYSWDDANRLTGLKYDLGGSTLGNLIYSYDAAARVTGTDGTLSNINPGTPVANVTFDANNRIKNWGAQTLTYDNNGNLINDGSNAYGWDERGRLVTITGAVSAVFAYDGLGRRVSKTIAGIQTGYVYDGANVVQELSGSSVLSNFIVGTSVDEWFERQQSAVVRVPLVDALGSVRALADASGVIKTTYSYDAYGLPTPAGATDGNAYQYTGREDDVGGLHFYRARYYQPKYAAFISEDPLGWRSGQTNGYSYVDGNPLGSSDPSGLMAFSWRQLQQIASLIWMLAEHKRPPPPPPPPPPPVRVCKVTGSQTEPKPGPAPDPDSDPFVPSVSPPDAPPSPIPPWIFLPLILLLPLGL
jgi:RHS repeat-associated protein